jgi:TRAP-type C4-dicarboxylate transport system permease small subunit
MVMAGVVLAAQHGAHISIVWLTEKFSPPLRRGVRLLNGLILMAGYSYLAWGTYTLMPIVHTEHSHVLHVPTSVTYGCMLVGFIALVLTSLTQALRGWHAGESTSPPAAH